MSRSSRLLFVCAVALVAVLASQALAAAAAPPQRVDVGRATGTAAFAYLGGLRTFAAAVLWNRIDPLFHDYYEGGELSGQHFMIPTMALVQALDPQFTQSYYVSSWIVARSGDYEQGLEIAREGVRNNPNSGLMRLNLTQLLFLDDKDAHRDEMLEHVEAAFSQEMHWTDQEEIFEAIALFRDVYAWAGDAERAAGLTIQLEELREAGIGLGDHDHDGDGEQDH